MATITIRPEQPADIPAIHHVNAIAARPQEARLVDVLRQDGAIALSLVAEVEGDVVGHILFTPVRVERDAGEWTAVALGPMAVLPEQQRQGIGSALIEHALAACRERGDEVVFVLGHPTYYPRFGFAPAATRGLRSQWNVPDDVFMVMALVPAALDGRQGTVYYHPAFDAD